MMGIRQCRSFQRDTSGATAIEFAFLVGPLLLLLIGTIEVGRLMWSGHALDEVAISAARCMGIRATGCAEEEQVIPERTNAFIISAAQSWGLVLDPTDISLNADAGCAGDTGFLRVALSFSFVSVLPGLDGATLQAEACFPDQL